MYSLMYFKRVNKQLVCQGVTGVTKNTEKKERRKKEVGVGSVAEEDGTERRFDEKYYQAAEGKD